VEYDTGRKMRDLMRLIERQVLRQDLKQVGTSSVPALAGGLKAFIPSANQVNLSAALVAAAHAAHERHKHGVAERRRLRRAAALGSARRRVPAAARARAAACD
jgi:hypothetical protein